MKKMMFSLAMVAACAWAQEPAQSNSDSAKVAPATQQQSREVQAEKASWPVWLAFNSTKNIDVIGMRINCAYGACEGKSLKKSLIAFASSCTDKASEGLSLYAIKS